MVSLIDSYKPDAVLNVALPYQDLTIMDACVECKVSYVDTIEIGCKRIAMVPAVTVQYVNGFNFIKVML